MNSYQVLLISLLIHVNAFAAEEVLYSCEQLKDSTNRPYSIELVEKDFHKFVINLKDETKGTLSEIEMFQNSKYDANCKTFLNKQDDQLHFNCAQFRENGKPSKMITAQFDKKVLIRIQTRSNGSDTNLSLSGTLSHCKAPSKEGALVYFQPSQKSMLYEDAETRCTSYPGSRLVDGLEALLAPVEKDGYKFYETDFWTTDSGGYFYYKLVVEKRVSSLPYRYYLRPGPIGGSEFYNTAQALCVTP